MKTANRWSASRCAPRAGISPTGERDSASQARAQRMTAEKFGFLGWHQGATTFPPNCPHGTMWWAIVNFQVRTRTPEKKDIRRSIILARLKLPRHPAFTSRKEKK